jgi:hypothetical protein
MGVEGSNRSKPEEAVDAGSFDHGPNDTRNATVQIHPRGRSERIYRAREHAHFGRLTRQIALRPKIAR